MERLRGLGCGRKGEVNAIRTVEEVDRQITRREREEGTHKIAKGWIYKGEEVFLMYFGVVIKVRGGR